MSSPDGTRISKRKRIQQSVEHNLLIESIIRITKLQKEKYMKLILKFKKLYH